MPDKVNYSIVESDSGNLAVQSTIASFGLDHVTQKEIVSFYSNFSQYAAWDTGLLPVEGSGILSLRTAGEYTQFAYQHKPGLYHVNWAAYEGGNATSYYVAQPYRIIICDMKEGNLLGARMFYSPYPITHPSQQLYHVNLPNINCKGYRGNGVGWICLYQNEDWSHLPLNERIVRFIERCSGVETYNDANMSETDGTRFYQEHSKPHYLWNPLHWQDKSAQEGFEWTLSESLWIPVLVQSMDQQDKHVNDGVPLTFADALVGDYQAYYYDKQHTKPINAIIRPDKNLSDKEVMSYFTKSYTISQTKTNHLLNNTFEASNKVKDDSGSSIFTGSSLLHSPETHQSEEEFFECSCCGDEYSGEDQLNHDYYDNTICSNCFEHYYVYVESAGGSFHNEDSKVYYASNLNQDGYYHEDFDTVIVCDSCGEVYACDKHAFPQGIYHIEDSGSNYCHSCAVQYYSDKGYEPNHECFKCKTDLYPEHLPNSTVKTFVASPYLDYSQDPPVPSNQIVEVHFCLSCSTHNQFHICPCGMAFDKNSSTLSQLPIPHQEMLNDSDDSILITKACAGCKSAPFEIEDGELILVFEPQDKKSFKEYHVKINGNYTKFHQGVTNQTHVF